jgi:2-polyprenyl-3-methyl-5-hydroxy-6-metoxy-1,4-benzoquinol methylase
VSKYRQRGAYHYAEFAQNTPYKHHVLDLIDQIQKVLPAKSSLLDVGAGEGLILSRLAALGYRCKGCDLDPHAITLAEERNNDVRHGTIQDFMRERFDAVLLCDVLEHVPSPIAVMAQARELAPLVVIAVPDRHDRHALHEVDPAAVKSYMEPSGYKCVHQSQRHARHLLIFQQ